MPGLSISLGTRVVVRRTDGADVTPRGQKEAAILAILALSPEMRRPRIWLQDKLWSDRFTEQGGMSLRRALANIRKTLGAERDALCADKRAVWLDDRVRVRQDTAVAAEDFLSELSIADAEFEQWRRETSADLLSGPDPSSPHGTTRGGAPSAMLQRFSPRPTRLRMILPHARRDGELAQLERMLVDRLAERFLSRGPITVDRGETQYGAEPGAAEETAQLVLEIETSARDHVWNAQFRLMTGSGRYFLWAGHLQQPLEPATIWKSHEVAAFLNGVVSTAIERSFARFRGDRFFQLQHAASLMFTGQRRDIEAADSILSALDVGAEGQPVVHAWRAFQRLTDFLEFGGSRDALRPEALDFAEDAARYGQSNSLVLALLAQIEMKFNNDPDRAALLSGRALGLRDDDPYALSAAGHAATLLGQFEESFEMSHRARLMAQGLPNAFIWDMQASLASLALGRWQEAYDLANRAHLGMARYRPALRYLVALSLLLDRPEEALRFTERLRLLEPSFRAARLAEADYPAHTLRILGLDAELRI